MMGKREMHLLGKETKLFVAKEVIEPKYRLGAKGRQ